MKKLLLTFCLLVAALQARADDVVIDGISYYINNSSKFAWVREFVDPEGVDEVSIPKTISAFGLHYTVVGIQDFVFRNCEDIVWVYLPESLESIGYGAFEGCKNLETLEAPGVTTIETDAFAGCALEELQLPAVNVIADGAFHNCENLTHVELGPYVYLIGENAFVGCSNEMTISIEAPVAPNIMPRAFDEAFYGEGELICPEGARVAYAHRFFGDEDGAPVNEAGREIVIRGGVGAVELFRESVHTMETRAVQRLRIDGNLSLGDWVNAKYFLGPASGLGGNARCVDLTSATFKVSGNLTSWGNMKMEKDSKIPDYAFEGCATLDTIFLPKSATSEVGNMTMFGGRNMFYGTPSRLVVVAPYAYTRLGALSPGFSLSDPFNRRTLLVPKGYLDIYKQAEGWKEFPTIREYDPDYYQCDVNGDAAVNVGDVTTIVNRNVQIETQRFSLA